MLTVDRHLLVEFVQGLLQEGLRNGHARIRNEDVDFSKIPDHLGNGGLHIPSVRHCNK